MSISDRRVATTLDTIGIARPVIWRLLGASALGAGAIGATVALMATSAWMLSRASQEPGEAALGLSIVAVQVFGLSRGFLRYGERLVGHDAALRLLEAIRVNFYDRIERLAPAGLAEYSSGDLLARLLGDVDALQDLLLRVVPPFATALLVGVLTVIGLWMALPVAGATLLVALLVAGVAVPRLTGWLSKRASSTEAELRARLATEVVELVESSDELVVFGAMDDALARATKLDASLSQASARAARTSGTGAALTLLCAGLASTACLAEGVAAARAGTMSPLLVGVLAVVPLAAFELLAPLPAASQALARARRCAARLTAVEVAPQPFVRPAQPRSAPPDASRVVITNASATYPAAPDRVVLHGIDLVVEPGRLVAVVGRSGSGKSTLGSLVVGFLSPSAGHLALGDAGYAELTGDEIRGVVGIVEQEPHLFGATIASNLRVAAPDASDDRLRSAVAAVGLDRFVASLPKGLATDVGRAGTAVSGGERQRLGIARAELTDWRVVVYDEPFEHLDDDAADHVRNLLFGARSRRGALVITHRLRGLERADEIVVLDEGAVIERGTHDELLAAGGWYAAQWRDEQLLTASTP